MLNPYLFGPLLIWFVAQLIKFSLSLIRGESDVRYLFAAGGMPSAHSAVVTSLATIALVDAGFKSPLFGITALLAAIVMYDSFGVRRSAGDQARTLNRLIDDLATSGNLRTAQDYRHLREILGHQPNEVAVGAALGIIGGIVIEYNKLNGRFNFLLTKTSKPEAFSLAVGAAVILLATLIINRRLKQASSSALEKTYAKRTLVTGLIGTGAFLGLAFASLQNALYISSQIVTLLTVTLWLLVVIALFRQGYKKIVEVRRAEKLNSRKKSWLKKAGKLKL